MHSVFDMSTIIFLHTCVYYISESYNNYFTSSVIFFSKSCILVFIISLKVIIIILPPVLSFSPIASHEYYALHTRRSQSYLGVSDSPNIAA